MAGVERFELPDDGVRVRSLTAWRHPNIIQTIANLPSVRATLLFILNAIIECLILTYWLKPPTHLSRLTAIKVSRRTLRLSSLKDYKIRHIILRRKQ